MLEFELFLLKKTSLEKNKIMVFVGPKIKQKKAWLFNVYIVHRYKNMQLFVLLIFIQINQTKLILMIRENYNDLNFFNLVLLLFFRYYSLQTISYDFKKYFQTNKRVLKETELGPVVKGHNIWQWPNKSHAVRRTSLVVIRKGSQKPQLFLLHSFSPCE